MQERDLGPLGETEFSRLCHSVGITINKSAMDRTGWDFFIEFPWKQDSSIPKDMLPSPLECKIQIKATDKQRRRESITLSNLSKLVKAQMPAFFCFIEFNGTNNAQSIYLVHVGKEIIERTLKRLRECENVNNAKPLNKQEITINYNNENILEDVTGESLKRAIERYVPHGMKEYIQEKNELLETLGYEDGKYQLTVTIGGSDPVRDLLDVSLGIREEIDIESSTGYYNRFGILSKNADTSHEGGVLSLQVKPIEAKLKFKQHQFSPAITFPAQFHVSPLTRFLPRERLKFRVGAKFFDFIIEVDKEISFTVDFNAQNSSLEELKNFLEVLTLLESSTTLIVELEVKNAPPSQLISLSSSNLPSSFFEPIVINGRVYRWEEISELAKAAIEISNKVYIREDILLSLYELVISFERADTQVIYQALCGDVKNLLFLPSGIDEFEEATRVACVFFAKTTFGNCTFGYCLGVIGSLSFNNGHRYLTGEKLLVGRLLIETSETTITRELIEPGLNELIEALQSEDLAIITVS